MSHAYLALSRPFSDTMYPGTTEETTISEFLH